MVGRKRFESLFSSVSPFLAGVKLKTTSDGESRTWKRRKTRGRSIASLSAKAAQRCCKRVIVRTGNTLYRRGESYFLCTRSCVRMGSLARREYARIRKKIRASLLAEGCDTKFTSSLGPSSSFSPFSCSLCHFCAFRRQWTKIDN